METIIKQGTYPGGKTMIKQEHIQWEKITWEASTTRRAPSHAARERET